MRSVRRGGCIVISRPFLDLHKTLCAYGLVATTSEIDVGRIKLFTIKVSILHTCSSGKITYQKTNRTLYRIAIQKRV